jgi:hypothetical protein
LFHPNERWRRDSLVAGRKTAAAVKYSRRIHCTTAWEKFVSTGNKKAKAKKKVQ